MVTDWLDERPTLLMKREIENAFSRWMLDNNIGASEARTADVTLEVLHKYLKQENSRWSTIRNTQLNTGKSHMCKNLWAHLHNRRKEKQTMKDLLEFNAHRTDLIDLSAFDTESEQSQSFESAQG